MSTRTVSVLLSPLPNLGLTLFPASECALTGKTRLQLYSMDVPSPRAWTQLYWKGSIRAGEAGLRALWYFNYHWVMSFLRAMLLTFLGEWS